MKAIILAAGVGKRLFKYTDEPKCLLRIGSEILIERYLCSLSRCGIEKVVLVVGYKKEKIMAVLRDLKVDDQIIMKENPSFEKGSILSLWTATDELNEDVILMDADVYFEQLVLDRLINSRHKNCIIIDTTSFNSGEEVMAVVKNGKVDTFGRGLVSPGNLVGEWVGFLKIDQCGCDVFKDVLAENVVNDALGYEDVLPQLFKRVEFGCELIDGLKWVEIDFTEDVIRANMLSGML